MLKDITVGQYYPGQSFLHRLDPRAKIIGLALYMTALFLVRRLAGFGYVAVFTVLLIASSGVPPKVALKGIKPIWPLLAFTLVLNFFLTPAGEVLWRWGALKVTDAGITRGIFMTLRLVLLLNATALLTLTTTPIRLTDGLERVMGRLRVPMAHELAMMMTIALRFIPTLIEETERLMKAQTARGADFERGGLIARAKSLIPLLVPLFVGALRRADDLATAMEARCYRGGEGRTRLRPLRYQARDGAALLLAGGLLALTVADRYWLRWLN
ncbi:MAG: energy-coupling factor transporter transmembrane protein EcfT [Peptococcaceae bacterium]|jgi:energy-coupling factor transport system permease protein|nr:energy-coupling factor transporter transmembrane protein EcfT [Peptococcaceae bacterium]